MIKFNLKYLQNQDFTWNSYVENEDPSLDRLIVKNSKNLKHAQVVTEILLKEDTVELGRIVSEVIVYYPGEVI